MFLTTAMKTMASSAATTIAGPSFCAENAFHGTKTRAFNAVLGTALLAVPFFVLALFLALLSLLDLVLLVNTALLLLAGLLLVLRSGIMQCRRK